MRARDVLGLPGLAVIVAIAAVACDAPEREPSTEPPAADVGVDPQAPDPDGEAGGREPAEAGTRAAPAVFAPIDHSGVTGTVVVGRADDWALINVSVEGLDPRGTYTAHVHEDRCAVNGPARVPLGRIQTDGATAVSVELRAERAEMPVDQPWSVQVLDGTGKAVACATVLGT